MADSPREGTEASGTRSSDPVRAALLETVASHPGMHRAELAQRVREKTGVPVATAVTRIRALEREGGLGGRVDAAEAAGEAPPAAASGEQDSAEPADDEAPTEQEPSPAPVAESALRAYRERRQPAVRAYCEVIAPPAEVFAAVDAAFATFAEEVHGASAAADPDELLLAAARWAAAERAFHRDEGSVVEGSRGRRLLASVREAARPATCDVTSYLVIAIRADGALSERQSRIVRAHIDHCGRCRAVESRQWEAQGAFRQRIAESPLDAALTAALVPPA